MFSLSYTKVFFTHLFYSRWMAMLLELLIVNESLFVLCPCVRKITK